MQGSWVATNFFRNFSVTLLVYVDHWYVKATISEKSKSVNLSYIYKIYRNVAKLHFYPLLCLASSFSKIFI